MTTRRADRRGRRRRPGYRRPRARAPRRARGELVRCRRRREARRGPRPAPGTAPRTRPPARARPRAGPAGPVAPGRVRRCTPAFSSRPLPNPSRRAESWLPLISTMLRAGVVQPEQRVLAQLDGVHRRHRPVVDVPGDQHHVHLLGAGHVHQVIEERGLRRPQVGPVQRPAEVPVGGVQHAHGPDHSGGDRHYAAVRAGDRSVTPCCCGGCAGGNSGLVTLLAMSPKRRTCRPPCCYPALRRPAQRVQQRARRRRRRRTPTWPPGPGRTGPRCRS